MRALIASLLPVALLAGCDRPPPANDPAEKARVAKAMTKMKADQTRSDIVVAKVEAKRRAEIEREQDEEERTRLRR